MRKAFSHRFHGQNKLLKKKNRAEILRGLNLS